MNTKMIMLGILLIAGLSFAMFPAWQYEWQNHVSWRYNCNMEELSTEKYILAADYMYVYAQPYVQYSQITSMNNYLYYMQIANNGMHFEDYYVAPFRADMGAFNTNSGAFNTIFNAVLRTYLAHNGDREHVLDALSGFNTNYRNCVGAGPWPPPIPPITS